MDIRCIVLDLDMTTLDLDKTISPMNREALEYAMSRGVHVAIASGRAFDTLPESVTGIPGIEYAITSNGAAVYHIPTGERLAHHPLQPDAVERILRFAQANPCVLETFVDGKAYAEAAFLQAPVAYGAPANSVEYLQRTRRLVPSIVEFIRAHIDALDSLDLILDSGETNARLRALLRPLLPDCYITSSVPHLLEISDQRCGKHSGVRFLAEHLGLSPAEFAAFGDGDNDVDMLTFVGCGIAMANASPACLAAADQVTLHYKEHGVAHGIYNILHI